MEFWVTTHDRFGGDLLGPSHASSSLGVPLKAHSRTTCWKLKTSGRILQVVEKLIRGLAMEDSRNMFALFEYNGSVDKAIESRTIVADVLAKFEK